MKRIVTLPLIAVTIAAIVNISAGHAANPEKGQQLSRQCSVCHGKQGVARDPEVPNLAGQSSFYLEKSLKDFRSGAREDRRMTLVVKNLSDEDIKDIAAWYSSFLVTVSEPD